MELIGFKGLVHAIFTKGRVSAFIIDEAMVQIGIKYLWIWIAIEPIRKTVLGIHLSEEKHLCSRKF
jgi:hypothetical protein